MLFHRIKGMKWPATLHGAQHANVRTSWFWGPCSDIRDPSSFSSSSSSSSASFPGTWMHPRHSIGRSVVGSTSLERERSQPVFFCSTPCFYSATREQLYCYVETNSSTCDADTQQQGRFDRQNKAKAKRNLATEEIQCSEASVCICMGMKDMKG